jgi:hypothetical protein
MYELKDINEVIDTLKRHLKYRRGFALSQPRPSEVNEALTKVIRILNDTRTNNIHTGGDAASIPEMERNTSAEDDT